MYVYIYIPVNCCKVRCFQQHGHGGLNPWCCYWWQLFSFVAAYFHSVKTNIAPETAGLEDEFPFGKASLQVLC